MCTEKYRLMVREVLRKQSFTYLHVAAIKSLYMFWRSRRLLKKERDLSSYGNTAAILTFMLAIHTTNGF